MGYEPLHHKYRPQTFADLVGQEAIATTLTNAILTQRIAPAYLLTGARGTGKTSTARILAKSLNCLSYDVPTPKPCGTCDMCRNVTKGIALDVTEIDAASNTGVDNIRELIERAQFAPVQARYKVYAIDECLTGDSLVLTNSGLMRIDDPAIKGKKVLSYNDISGIWEYKKVLRWLDRGVRQTLIIKTVSREIRCTANHLIRTDRGWIPAQDVKEGMKILSPVPVVVECLFTSMGRTDAFANLPEGTSFTATSLAKRLTTLALFSNKPSLLNLPAHVDVVKSWIFQNFYNKKVEAFTVFNPIGQDIPIKKDMEFGNIALKSLLPMQEYSNQRHWDSSMGHCLVMAPSLIPTNAVDFPDYAGLTVKSSKNGWHTKPVVCQNYDQNSGLRKTKDLETHPFVVTQPVILNSKMCLISSNLMGRASLSLWTGLVGLLQKAWHGGIWMMERLFAPEVPQMFTYARKDIHLQKIKLLPTGLQNWAIQQLQDTTASQDESNPTTTSIWEQLQAKNGCQTSSSIQSHLWTTNLEQVESVRISSTEQVYDIEVEDNHNFVANGLLVHNCHMLSTAAFNALLKTLEEPPDRVVFILATTDPQRVLPTIISRCQRFDFRRIPLEAMVAHLQKIADIEGIHIAREAIVLVAQIAQGGLRDAESLLDQLSLMEGKITVEAVWDLVGSVPERDLLGLLEAIASDDGTKVLEQLRRVMDRGREPLIVLQNLAGLYRDLLIAKSAPERNDLVALTTSGWTRLQQLAQALSIPNILMGQQHLRSAEVQIKNSTQPRLWLEVTLLGLLPSAIGTTESVKSVPNSRIERVTPAPPSSTKEFKESINPQPAIAGDRELQVESPPIVVTRSEPPPPTSREASKQEADRVVSNNSSVSPPVVASQPLTEAELQATSCAAPVNLESAWQELMSNLPLPTTRALLAEHGRFVEVTQNIVKIGFKSPAIKKIAEEQKRDEITKSCEKVFGHPVQVVFGIASAKAATGSTSKKTAPSLSPASNTLDRTPQQIDTTSDRPENSTHSPILQPDTQVAEPTASLPSGFNGLQSPEEQAIKNIAQFFAGQIVNLDEES